MARIVGAPKVATGLSEAREAAGAIAEPRIACFLRSKKPPKELKFKTRHLSYLDINLITD